MLKLFARQRHRSGSRNAAMTGLVVFMAAVSAILTLPHSSVAQSALELTSRLKDLLDRAQFAEAISVAKKLYRVRKAELGVVHPDVGRLQVRIAELHQKNGEFDQAEQAYWQVVEVFADASGDDRRVLQTALGHLSILYLAQSRFDLAGQVTERLNAELKRAAASERAPREQARPLTGGSATGPQSGEMAPVPGQSEMAFARAQTEKTTNLRRGAVQDRSKNRLKDDQSPRTVASIAQPGASIGATGRSTGAQSCEAPTIELSWRPYGFVDILVRSQCRSGQALRLSYGSSVFNERFSQDGDVKIGLDLFAGSEVAVELGFEDGSSQALNIGEANAGEFSKVAVVWSGGVNLDLHAFEYAAGFNAPGHIWTDNPGGYDVTLNRVVRNKRGHGFLSSSSDGSGPGSHAEVFTFLHNAKQRYGAVRLALDHRSRGSVPDGVYCGDGAAASVTFEVYVREANGQVTRQTGIIPSAACGRELKEQARYIWSAVPDIRFRR